MIDGLIEFSLLPEIHTNIKMRSGKIGTYFQCVFIMYGGFLNMTFFCQSLAQVELCNAVFTCHMNGMLKERNAVGPV